MSARSATPLLDRVGELDVEVRRAQARLSELEAQRSASVRELERVRAPLLAYFEQVGAGEREPDPDEEARLLAAVSSAGAHVRLEVAGTLRGGRPTLVAIDERAERLVYGARRALQAAEDAVATFLRVERAGLAGELTAQAQAAQRAQEAAVPALAAAVQADREVRARWRRVLRANGQPDTLPRSPLRGWDDELAVDGGIVPLAVPAGLRDTAAA